MKNLKKPLAVLLVLAMLLGSFPTAVFAQEAVHDIVDAVPPPAAEEDTTGGAGLPDASDPTGDADAPAEEADGVEDYYTSGDSGAVAPPVVEMPEDDAPAEEAISPAYVGIAPFSTDLSGFDVHVGTPVAVQNRPANRDAMGLGEIWIGQSISYPYTLAGDGVTRIYDGTALINIYVWGRPFEEGASLLTREPGVDSFIHVSTRVGDFAVLDYVPVSGAVFSESGGVISWDIEEAVIIDPLEPLVLTYTLYLEDRDPEDWLTNFWYSTLGSLLEVRFQPNMDNPFYWTKSETETPAFQITANWNNGTGLNSATITDNELGITIVFGKNSSSENYSAAQRPYASYPSLWAPGAPARIVYDDGRPTDLRPWYLQWSKSLAASGYKEYYFTVHNFRQLPDGTWQDVTYFVRLDGMGGNQAGASSRTISSTDWFRKSTLPDGYEWDEEGYLVFRASNVAQVMLRDLDEPDPDTGTLVITKRPEAMFPDQEWYFEGPGWEFTMRLMAGDDYVMLEPTAIPNVYNFMGFVGDSTQGTTLVFSGTGDIAREITINNLPTHIHYDDTDPIDYWIYEFFLFETLDLIRVYYCLDGGIDLDMTHPRYDVFFTSPFEIFPDTTRTVKIVNEYDHGIGFLNVFKLMDGFHGDWGITNDTEFYVRIWDVDAGNYLLFYPDLIQDDDYDWLPIFAPRFLGTHWCVGNHELGLTHGYYATRYYDEHGEHMIPVMELPLTVYRRLRLSNLWTGIQYRVDEVQLVLQAGETEAQARARADAWWAAFWNGIGQDGRRPRWDPLTTWNPLVQGALIDDQWIGWDNGEVVGSEFWAPVREIADHLGGDAAWHDDKEWNWGVIYPDDNPSANLRFDLTETVTITNRYKFHCGNIDFVKVLCDNAEDWGITGDTTFYARVLAEDESFGGVTKALVFVPDPFDGQQVIWRVIGFMELNPVTGEPDPTRYTVLCPVGGATPPGHSRTVIPFSANVPSRLIEVPSYPFGTPIQYTIEEVFPGEEPDGFDDRIYLLERIEEDDTRTTFTMPFIIAHLEDFEVTIRNEFHPGNDVLLLSKVLDGFYEVWGVDEDTVFYASIYRVGTPAPLRFIWDGVHGVWVYENYLGIGSLTGTPTDVLPISAATNPVVVRGLYTYRDNYAVVELIHPTIDPDIFDAVVELDPVDVDNGARTNLVATVTNTFIEAYRVFYHPNGGTGTLVDGNNPYLPGDDVILLDNTFTRTGWTFIGWNTAADGSGDAYDEGDTYVMGNTDVTFYAQWEEDEGPPDPPDPPDPPRPPVPPPGGFFVDEHIWYLRGYDEGYLRAASVHVENPNAFTMRPNANITRAEVAMVFYRLLRPEYKDFVPENIPFSDVQGHEWFGLAVGTLTYYGVFQGNGGLFRPHDPITRRELAVVVSRFDNLADTSVNPYTDVDPSDWAYRYILSATARGWFIGFPDGTFRPGANLTRAEFATATNRVLERGILLEHIPDDVVEFIDLDGTHWAHADFMEAAHSHHWERHENGVTERWHAITGHGLDAAYNQ